MDEKNDLINFVLSSNDFLLTIVTIGYFMVETIDKGGPEEAAFDCFNLMVSILGQLKNFEKDQYEKVKATILSDGGSVRAALLPIFEVVEKSQPTIH